MSTQLALHIQQTPLHDTHEHLHREENWVDEGPDFLQDLFGNYSRGDLISAGASAEAVEKLVDAGDPDLGARFNGVREAWEAIQYTGYGEANRILAEQVYGLAGWSAADLEKGQEQLLEWRKPGGRLRLLRDVGNLDHVQIDDFKRSCAPDSSGPEFFLYDLSWAEFCSGRINFEALQSETGVAVTTLATPTRQWPQSSARTAAQLSP